MAIYEPLLRSLAEEMATLITFAETQTGAGVAVATTMARKVKSFYNKVAAKLYGNMIDKKSIETTFDTDVTHLIFGDVRSKTNVSSFEFIKFFIYLVSMDIISNGAADNDIASYFDEVCNIFMCRKDRMKVKAGQSVRQLNDEIARLKRQIDEIKKSAKQCIEQKELEIQFLRATCQFNITNDPNWPELMGNSVFSK